MTTSSSSTPSVGPGVSSPKRSGHATQLFGDSRDDVLAGLDEASISWSLRSKKRDDGTEYRQLLIDMPNVSGPPRLAVMHVDFVDELRAVNFAKTYAIGPYEALLRVDADSVEASIQADTNRGAEFLVRLADAPDGLDDGAREARASILPEYQSSRSPSPQHELHKSIRLESTGGSIALDISRPTAELALLAIGTDLAPWKACLKFRGLPTGMESKDATVLLESISSALFFELDLKHGIGLRLARHRDPSWSLTARSRRDPLSIDAPLRVPTKKYSNDAISLYTYGRSASDMPLLQFLAYYQCVEHFLPQYWNQELVGRVRRALNDPRFDSDESAHIGKILQIASSAGRSGAPERDQLRATIENCTDSSELEEFLQENDAVRDALTDKHGVGGLRPLALKDKNHSLTSQVATRIYDLRCRIVHSKDASETSLDSRVLLPFSTDADRLDADIALVKFVTQKAIIASGRNGGW